MLQSPIAAQPARSSAASPAHSGPEIPPHASAASLPPLSDMTISQLLLAKRDGQCASKDVWEMLISLNTTAGRELLDSCRMAAETHHEAMAFTMATLFCSPAQERTLAGLDEAGIFIDPARREHLRPSDAALLMSDEGLQLWLRFAASPSAYPSVFVDSILNETSSAEPEDSLASALKVLVISGRDKTNDVAVSEIPGNFHLPLSHLCCRVAPQWLPSLLEFGTDPNQLTANGVPLVATAMAAQAERLRLTGHDLLTPHASLYQLASMLRSHGARLSLRSRTGAPPVMLLALNGYCAAAEALLSAGADCNATADNVNGNTLMHSLAAATHLGPHSFSAFFLLTLALRYGGDFDQPNHDGVAARALVSESLAQYLRVSQTMVASTRERARCCISTAPRPHSRNAGSHVPSFITTFAAQASRLCARGHDPLLPHESLFRLAISLQRDGADLGQRHADGTPPVLWLTRRGYCGAAEVLLALCPNANVPGREGHTLMHALAAATRAPDGATLADYMLTTALRYGGDPTLTNRSGITALSFLSADQSRFVRAGFALITATRKSAHETVTRRHPPIVQPADEPMRHSAASL
ncbi:ankyrin [Pandoraea communis]|uniref:Ankyrin n=2 Tax=Pandoraea communis TaxID=2508297 RepID=A0A5E4XEW2_9BURK|nr:ankyrin [Pandoraea communis]